MTPGPGPVHLVLRQRSAWRAFPCDLLDARGAAIGWIDWPQRPQAGRRDPKRLGGTFPLVLRGRHYGVEQRGPTEPEGGALRLTLVGSEGEVRASVDIPARRGGRPARLEITAPVEGEVRPGRAWLRMVYGVELRDGQAGEILEPHWFSLKRELHVGLPRVDDTLRALLALAVLVSRTSYRTTIW